VSYQAYLDNIHAKTGITPGDFLRQAGRKGLHTRAEIITWLKEDFTLGYGHANLVTALILHKDDAELTAEQAISAHFAGSRMRWRPVYDDLIDQLARLGKDVRAVPTQSYISLLRADRKFGIIQISNSRLDIGIKLKGFPPAGRFAASGSWNAMVTHRVRITDPDQIDLQLLEWLRQPYLAAGTTA
jgi:hypothetical protein